MHKFLLPVSHNTRLLKIFETWFFILTFLSMSICSNGQMQIYKIHLNIQDTIRMIYDKYLLPPVENNNIEVATFWLNPDDQPEYTLRIIKNKDLQYHLEGRFLTKSIGKSLNDVIQQPKKRLSMNVELSTVAISEIFKQEMLSSFLKTMSCHKSQSKDSQGLSIYDGVCYQFKINDDKNEILQDAVCDLKKSDSCYESIMLYLQMAEDLKEHSFIESKYLSTYYSFFF